MTKISKTKLKEQRIKNFLSSYKTPFDITDNYIDLRTMGDNYTNGIIPNKDIGDAVSAVLGPSLIPRLSVNPRQLKNIPKFTWVPMDNIAIKPIFQRDVISNHVNTIEQKFTPGSIIVPCAVKDPYSDLFLLWDGHHTTRVCERQGWSEMPVWYTEALIDDEHSLEEASKILIKHAGQSMIMINKTGKRPLGRYDEHMISVECGYSEAIVIQNICDANNVKIKRASKQAGEISHIEHLYGAYNLTSPMGVKGIYLARALRFHRAIWPNEEIRGIVMFGMARLYHQTEIQTGVLLPQTFDDELGEILKEQYGPSEAVHDEKTGFKAQYISHFGSLAGHPECVTAGLILTYYKHGSNKFKLAQPENNYPVK